nr:lmo0937 family membrane protein [uncultured Draconibacterium sp.]
MRSLLYIIAVILVIGWIFGFLVYSVGSLIHILLILAVISILLSLIKKR